MGLFDSLPFMKGNEEKQNLEAERREKDFIKERDVFQAGVTDDQTQLYEREARSDLIRWQQELDDELLSGVQTLLGMEKNNDGEWIKVGEPLCNPKFVREVVVPHCKPFLSRNMINSHLEEKRILAGQRNTIHDIIDVMCDAFDLYDIEFRNFDSILRVIKNIIEPGPYRALKGFTKKQDNTMNKRIETFQDQPQRQAKSIWGNK